MARGGGSEGNWRMTRATKRLRPAHGSIGRLAILLCALLVAFAGAAAAQVVGEADEPTLFERGELAYQQQDWGNALRWFVQAANKGDSAAQNMIGEMYGRGEGVGQNDAEALRWFTLAAEQKNHEAETNLGITYREGYGVTRNYDQAYAWLERAAKAQYPAAIYHLGVMYEHEMLIAEDEDVWIDMYERAAELGYGPAQARIGHMYENGVVFDQSYSDAIYWYNLATAHGETTAIISLAQLYINGEGVTQDLVQAHALLTVASFLGNRGAAPLIANLAGSLNKEQLDQSQLIASGILAKVYAPKGEEDDSR
jgi:TPR repeat protein